MEVKKSFIAIVLGLGFTLVLVWLLGGGLSITRAATIGVTVTTDDRVNNGNCTLREAIIAANTDSAVDACAAGSGADIISLATGTYALTVVGTGENAGLTGDLDITGPLTITGVGPDQTIIDASGVISDRVLDIRLGAGTVVISGVTIIHGNTDDDGGGIYNDEANLTLINTVVSSNTARYGGGLYLEEGSATLSEGRIVSNTALLGGGVHLQQSTAAFTQTGGVVAHNVANYGGGVNVQDGRATLSGGQIFSNTAGGSGGGVRVGSGSATLSGGQILSNAADMNGGGVFVSSSSGAFAQTSGVLAYNTATNNGRGGGVYVKQGSATLSGGQIVSNAATYVGGGVYVSQVTAIFTQTGGVLAYNAANSGGGVGVSYGRATFSGGQVSSNTVGYYGGGVYVERGDATLSGGRIVSNTADERGGGVYVYLGRAMLSSGQVVSNFAVYGGGVYVGGSATLSGGQVLSNTAERGGGVYIGGSGTFTQTGDSAIVRNTGTINGGGVYVGDGSATMNGGQIVSNTAGSGGGVYIAGNGTFTQTGDSIIARNTGTVNGGGMYVSDGSATLDGGRIVSNTASSDGGGVYVSLGDATLSGGQILSNAAGSGGGVYVASGSAAFTQTGDSIIAHNTVVTNGGGVYIASGRAALQGGQILSNTADGGGSGAGGGMYLEQGSATLSGGQIRGNNARHYGGGVYVYEATAAFTQTGVATITHNTAGNKGGGLYVYQGRVTLSEGALCNNKANGGTGGGVHVASDANVHVSQGQIVSNTAYYGGGGVYHSDGTLTLVNTTVSENRATSTSPPSAGGGIYVDGGTAVLTYTTVVSNVANSGGRGVHRVGGAVFLGDTIVAHNGASNCAGTLTSNGHNLEDANTCGFNAASDQSNTDPRLGPLTDDGGTLIYPLLLGSPAVDAGTCVVGIATDQRGQPRPNPATPLCDIGAYEARTPAITVTKSGTAWFNPRGRITYTLHVANTGTLTATNVVLTDALPAGATFVDAGGGELESGDVVSWTVSSIPPGGGPVTRTFTVTATDTITNDDYRATPESLPSVRGTVVVASSLNHKPAADAGASQTVAAGGSVTLDGSGSRDDDGHPLVYGWEQTGGTEVTLIGTTAVNPTFTAPPTTGVLTFTLTVTDTLDMSDAHTTTVTVEQYCTYLPLVLRDSP